MRYYYLLMGSFYLVYAGTLLFFPQWMAVAHSGVFADPTARHTWSIIEIGAGCALVSCYWPRPRLIRLLVSVGVATMAGTFTALITYLSITVQHSLGSAYQWGVILGIHILFLLYRLEREEWQAVVRRLAAAVDLTALRHDADRKDAS